MGNMTQVTGEITITPPLSWAELKKWSDILRAAGSRSGWSLLLSREDKVVIEIDEGTQTKITSSALVPYQKSRFSGAESLVDYLQAALDQWGKNHAFSGYFECVDEGGGTWRVRVGKDGAAQTVYPELIWPED